MISILKISAIFIGMILIILTSALVSAVPIIIGGEKPVISDTYLPTVTIPDISTQKTSGYLTGKKIIPDVSHTWPVKPFVPQSGKGETQIQTLDPKSLETGNNIKSIENIEISSGNTPIIINPSKMNTFEGQYLSYQGYGWCDIGGKNNSYFKITLAGTTQYPTEFHLINSFTTKSQFGILIQASNVRISGVDLSTASGADQRPVNTITHTYAPVIAAESGAAGIKVSPGYTGIKLVNVNVTSNNFPALHVDGSNVEIIGTNNPDPYLTTYSGAGLNSNWGTTLTSSSKSGNGIGLLEQTTSRSSLVNITGSDGNGVNITGPFSGIELNGKRAQINISGNQIYIEGTGTESGTGSDRNSGITAWGGSTVTIIASNSSILGEEYGIFGEGGAIIQVTCSDCSLGPIQKVAGFKSSEIRSSNAKTLIQGGLHGLFLTGTSSAGYGTVFIDNITFKGLTGYGIDLSQATGYNITITNPGVILGYSGKIGSSQSSSNLITSEGFKINTNNYGPPYQINISLNSISGPDPYFFRVTDESGTTIYDITNWDILPDGVRFNSTSDILSFESDILQLFYGEKYAPSYAAPTVHSIIPSMGQNTGTTSITNLAGTGFQNGATVKLTRSGVSDILATDINVVSSTQITCTLPISGKSIGNWNIVVTNTDEQTGTKVNGFTITAPPTAPVITSINPSTAQNTSSVSITNLAGTGFQNGATVKLTRSGVSDILATDVNVVSSTQITCILPIYGKAVGDWNIIVTNKDGQSATKENGFTITTLTAAPTITSMTPSTGINTDFVSISNLTGTGFKACATVKLTRTGKTAIIATNVKVVSATKITCTLPISGKTVGDWDIVVTNTDGQSATKENGFTVAASTAALTVTSMTPSTGINTGSVRITNLAGTGFRAGATVKLTRTGKTAIIATNVKVVSATKITCTLPITGKTTGKWNVVVTNRGGQSGGKANGFSIKNTEPAITSITPSICYPTANWPITISGKNFRDTTIKISKGSTTKTATIQSQTTTRIKAFLPTKGIATGTYDLTVMNRDGTTKKKIQLFTVKAAGEKPTITSITPKTILNSANTNITIKGTNFRKNAVIQMIKDSTTKKATISTLSSTKIVCTLSTNNMAEGLWSVKITNEDGTIATKSKVFAVRSGISSSVIADYIDPLTGMQRPVISNSGVSIQTKPFGKSISSSIINPPDLAGTTR